MFKSSESNLKISLLLFITVFFISSSFQNMVDRNAIKTKKIDVSGKYRLKCFNEKHAKGWCCNHVEKLLVIKKDSTFILTSLGFGGSFEVIPTTGQWTIKHRTIILVADKDSQSRNHKDKKDILKYKIVKKGLKEQRCFDPRLRKRVWVKE